MKNVIHKILLVLPIATLAFFVFGEQFLGSQASNAYAFGHPDSTAPSLVFSKPDAGFPMNPRVTGSAAVSFRATDTTTDDQGGEVVSCSLSTKNGDEVWVSRGTVGCNIDFTVQDAWCNKEGTGSCGVRIDACDNNDRCVRGERFFPIDYTPPTIEISSNRSDPTQKTDARFRFSASDGYGVRSVGCALDVLVGPLPFCNSPQSYSGLRDGAHTFRVSAVDRAGNKAEKTLVWEVDSTPPGTLPGFIAFGATYFSEILNWIAPGKDGPVGGASSQYDIRYSVAPITESSWNDATALVYREHQTVPPKSPGSREQMTIGPERVQDLEEPRSLGLFSDFNLLSANTKHYFGIKTRDEKWNWSGISTPINTDGLWTLRDLCDYDADRLYSPKFACGPRACDSDTQTCDLYDNPFDWSLPDEPGQYNWSTAPGFWPVNKPDDFWIKAFGATARDLDQDGQDVAEGRMGVDVSNGEEVTGYPAPGGRDWYDNPFTAEVFSLDVSPTLKQLSATINDLDLDTFVSRDWKTALGRDELSEPADKDLDGRVYPDARESTCLNCTAYNPDPATGRVPSGKTTASTNKNRAVGQIEAYYTQLRGQNPPYEVIKETSTAGGTINSAEEVITASAQCGDGLNNDLASGADSSEDPADPNREINCPTRFQTSQAAEPATTLVQTTKDNVLAAAIFPQVGLVQCGRHADDYTTPIDESADCGFCSLLALFGNLTNLIVLRIMPILAVLSLVIGGLLMVFSAGNVERFAQGRGIIRWAFTSYAVTLLAWMVMTTVFSLVGVAKWTGFTPERGDIKELSETSLTVSSRRWGQDAWKGYAVQIRSPGGEEEVRKIVANTSDTLILDQDQPFQTLPGQAYRYHILHTGWWNFVCGISTSKKADFAASPSSGVAPFTVDFTDLSEGEGITAWSWDFGDGGGSSEQSPKHEYTTNGPHTVRLTVQGPGGSDRATKTVRHAPTAEFSSSRPHGRAPLRVQFQDTSTGGIDGWSWDFNGDNREDSREQNPVYTYATPGPYRVKLTVSGPGGRDTESKLNYVFVYPNPPAPVADFATSTVPSALTVTTDNLSFAATPSPPEDHITSWLWDFGDGRGVSAVEDPKYFYGTRAEPYTLLLTAGGPGGENSTSTEVAFVPGANFTSDKASGAVPLTLRLKDSSTGTVSGLTWDFGDDSALESAELGASVTHTYTKNGTYTVTLKAKGPAGESEFTRDAYIAVAPRAGFSYSSVALSDPTGPANCTTSSGCTVGSSGARVTFANTSECRGACTSYWEFGDGGTQTTNGLGDVTYTYAGTSEVYTVRLTVTGPGGGDTMTRRGYMRIAPWAQISPMEAGPFTRTEVYDCDGLVSQDPPVSVSFSDVSEPQNYIEIRQWSAGETGGSITREFENNGSVSLTATNARGQSDTAVANVEVNIHTVDTCPPPPEPAVESGPTLFEQITEEAQQVIRDLFNFIPGFGSSEPSPVFETLPEDADVDIGI